MGDRQRPFLLLLADTIGLFVVGIPPGFTTCLSVFIATLAAEGTMMPLPFHFPLAVFELPHRHPGFVLARVWRQISEIRAG